MKDWLLLILGIILILTWLLAPIGAGLLIWLFYKKNKKLKKYDSIINVEEEVCKLTTEKDDLDKKFKALKSKYTDELKTLKSKKQTLSNELSILEEKYTLSEYALYEPKYDFDSHVAYEDRLLDIRDKQKLLIKDKEAVRVLIQWQVEGSAAKGRKMTNHFVKLIIRAFNGECDACISKVKYNNIDAMEKRIEKSFEQINKLGVTTQCEITRDYLNAKLEELYLVHEFQEFKQEQKEEQRRIKEQMREEARAQRELEKAKADAEKEESRYQKALEQAKADVENATGKKLDGLNSKILELEQKLKEAQEKKERAISRAQMTRSGHVYIISNIGSFGEDIYKIGMTRRLEPLDRVKELGDASVPFQFDVHAMIFSEDAPGLENKLHKTFNDDRVNRINLRKEYFNVPLEKIKEIVDETSEAEISFTMVAEAKEFRMSQAKILDVS